MTWTCLSWGLPISGRLPRWYSNKDPACQCRRRRVNPWVGKIPWKEMATHCSTLAWKIPWTEEPGGLQAKGSERVSRDWCTKHNTHFRKCQLHSSSSQDKSYGNDFNSSLSSNSANIQSVTLSTPHVTLHGCSGQIPRPPLPAPHRNLKQAPSFHPHTLMPTMNTGAGLGLLRYTVQGLHVAPGLVHNSSSRSPSKSGLLLDALLISPLLLGLWPHWPPSVLQADQVAPPWRLTLALSWV